ncbi:hypothetical protein MHYP_G00274630 [Metynnis hypsauchen]
MRNSLSLLEVELMELREHIHTHISTSTDMSFLRDQFSQIRRQLKMSVHELKGDTENLLQEKESLKNDLKQELRREIDFHPASLEDVPSGPPLTPYHLYDCVHLNKHTVKEFARTLKDVARGSHSYTAQQESPEPQQHCPRYTAISPVVHKLDTSTSAWTPSPTAHCVAPSAH